MMRLQHCTACGHAQYPPREVCGACLADALEWFAPNCGPGELLAVTILHHSHEPGFRARLPLRIGLVQLDAGPTVVCFLGDDCAAGARVTVTASNDPQGRSVLSAA